MFEHDYYTIQDALKALNKLDDTRVWSRGDILTFFNRGELSLSVFTESADAVSVMDYEVREGLVLELHKLRQDNERFSDKGVQLENQIVDISSKYKTTGRKKGHVKELAIDRIDEKGRLIFIIDDFHSYLMKSIIYGEKSDAGTELFLYRDITYKPLQSTSKFIYKATSDCIGFNREEFNRVKAHILGEKQDNQEPDTARKLKPKTNTSTRKHELHALIAKVDKSLVTDEKQKPGGKEVWKKLQDEEGVSVIQEITDDEILWKSKGGTEQKLSRDSFSSTLSKTRKKY